MPEKTGRKQATTRFKPGQSGNPSGRPRGARNKASVLAQKLMEGQAEAVVQTVIEAALTGDMAAARLIVERLVPPARERAIQADLKLPKDICVKSAPQIFGEIFRAVTGGRLLPAEGEGLLKLLRMYFDAYELSELERRVNEIESQQQSGGRKSW
ncbi:MAG TPA: hypothetical protein DGF30_02805 [Desulfomicrobium sp.]|nr:hypothetical protein [Desulfomicrobium sp.]